MYIKGKNHAAADGRVRLPAHPKKHHKPYRIRHVGLFVAGVLIIILSAFEGGYQLGRSGPVAEDGPTPPASRPTNVSTLGQVISGLGYSFRYDTSVFSAAARTGDQTVTGKRLKQKLDLTETTLHPRALSVNSQDSLSELIITMDKNSAQYDEFKLKNAYNSPSEALAGYFAPVNDQNFTYQKLAETAQTLGGLKMKKTVYRQDPEFGDGAKPVFSIMWTGIYHGKPVRIYLKSLLNKDQIPAIYTPVLDTLHFGSSTGNGVLSATVSDKDFDLNKVSPAVVKLYHLVCGTLVINNVSYGQDACDGGTGSGFLVSADGYIATSGHVVVLGAADILVNQLLNNPDLLQQFVTAAGLSSEQTTRSDVVASLLAKLYDLPGDKLRLDNRREATFAALGDQPIKLNSQEDAKKALKTEDNDYIKRAEVLAVDYQPKDLLIIEQNTQEGFSASDVALLKANIGDSPYIRLADSAGLNQNDPISLIGFPADADNQLTENTTISPSITKGVISSIRQANGSDSRLFQTDADASEGNSGGPALDAHGSAFGLVTYRFKTGQDTNAAKSYIRDIDDFSALVRSKDISLSISGGTQPAWEAGLDLFRAERYSKALVRFRQVKQSYPAQRLVNSYINRADQAVREGKDKKDPPYALLAVITGGLVGGALVFIASRLIIRHRQAHLDYKARQLGAQKTIIPAA